MTDITLYLLRHGKSVANVNRVFAARKIDPPLSEIGIQQACQQAELLKAIKFEAMYSSSLLRAKQTAEIVNQRCMLNLEFSDALWEVDVGILDGESQDDTHNQNVYEGVIKSWEQGLTSIGFPSGETLNDIRDRFRQFLNELEQKRQKCVLVVGHCLLFMAVIWLFCENHGPMFEDGHMDRGHLSIISKTGNRFRLLKFNISSEASVENILLV
jgi:broad specificity phosphatase PhoE